MNDYRTIGILSLTFLTGILVVAAGVLWVARDDRPPIQVVPPPAANPGNGGVPGEADASAVFQALEVVKVYISGAVVTPGVYILQEGDRLEDALDAAGGTTSDADLSAVNLALRVTDKRYYYIPEVGEIPPPAAAAVDSTERPNLSSESLSSQPTIGLIDLNTAPFSTLRTLPGIGDVRAQSIIDYREEHGPFQSVSEITLITGIGKTTYENLRDLVTVGAP